MSFRARLTLASAVAVALAVAVASAVVYVVVQRQLIATTDDGLRERAAEIANLPPGAIGSLLYQRLSHKIGEPTVYPQIVRSDHQVILPEGQPVSLPVNQRVYDVATTGKGAFFSNTSVNGTKVRVLTFPYFLDRGPFSSAVAIQIARPLNEANHALAQIQLLLFLVALGGVAIAGALGLVVSGAALAPVRRLTEATEHVASTEDLGSRIEVKGDDELSRLAASFNTMLEALDRSRQAQQQLIADASHELRTPLTSLRTNIEVLALDRSMPEADRKQLLSDVVEQLGEMTALVSELMELARGQHHEAEAEAVRLDIVVDEAVARARRNRPGIVFEADLHEATVHGVPGSIERAVSNLLDNAAKWSPEGGTVEVAVDGPQVTVRDHGPGIAEQDLPHVFDRFYRAANARGRPGSGLGLAIVRQVAESHGGSVVAEQPEDGGTRMRLRLEPNGRR